MGAAQIDKVANINTTAVGDCQKPKVRLPGGGGAPEIATSCGEILITVKHSRRSLVAETEPPSDDELQVLRDLQARTARAHGTPNKGEAA